MLPDPGRREALGCPRRTIAKTTGARRNAAAAALPRALPFDLAGSCPCGGSCPTRCCCCAQACREDWHERRRFLVNHDQQSISVVSFQQVAGHWALSCFGFLSGHEGPWAHRAPHEQRAFRRYCTRRINPWACTWPSRQFHYWAKHRNRIRWHDLAAALPNFQVSASRHCSPNCQRCLVPSVGSNLADGTGQPMRSHQTWRQISTQ
mmetsp:Transcript_56574/g.151197  ORF Transcript_56574/g.151197 Transcript_56574/m.151197 type:complete len:206 (+) Transcript_56574:514-1131(+)